MSRSHHCTTHQVITTGQFAADLTPGSWWRKGSRAAAPWSRPRPAAPEMQSGKPPWAWTRRSGSESCWGSAWRWWTGTSCDWSRSRSRSYSRSRWPGAAAPPRSGTGRVCCRGSEARDSARRSGTAGRVWRCALAFAVEGDNRRVSGTGSPGQLLLAGPQQERPWERVCPQALRLVLRAARAEILSESKRAWGEWGAGCPFVTRPSFSARAAFPNEAESLGRARRLPTSDSEVIYTRNGLEGYEGDLKESHSTTRQLRQVCSQHLRKLGQLRRHVRYNTGPSTKPWLIRVVEPYVVVVSLVQLVLDQQVPQHADRQFTDMPSLSERRRNLRRKEKVVSRNTAPANRLLAHVPPWEAAPPGSTACSSRLSVHTRSGRPELQRGRARQFHTSVEILDKSSELNPTPNREVAYPYVKSHVR